ncbi:hypothetical protein [Calothrix rhizosoleniae]|uniref:hypothetical protein n=1 Tax=Calothrix rhizosoleniae TaxID=888997 RepID=UPI000B49C129
MINNAGFIRNRTFHEPDLAKYQAIMQVNMVSLVNLIHIYWQGMVQFVSARNLQCSLSTKNQ